MKSIKWCSVLLLLAVIAVAIFLGGKQINSRIESTIKANYQSEIDILKEKINKQSELINSILNINNKENSNTDTNQIVTNTTTKPSVTNKPTTNNSSASEYEYIKEGHEIQDIYMELSINLTDRDGAYTGQKYVIIFNRAEIEKLVIYLNKVIKHEI